MLLVFGTSGPSAILAFLLELNQACTAREAVGEPITPPGLPLPAEDQAVDFREGDLRGAVVVTFKKPAAE